MSVLKGWMGESCIKCSRCVDHCHEDLEMRDLITLVEGVYYADYENMIVTGAKKCLAHGFNSSFGYALHENIAEDYLDVA